MRKRRECRILSRSDLLLAFENANTRIISKYTVSSNDLCGEGTALLRRLTAQFLRQEPNPLTEFTFQAPHIILPHPEPIIVNKPMEQPPNIAQDQRITFNQHTQSLEEPRATCKFGGEESERKEVRMEVYDSAVASKGIDQTTKKLSKSFKKLGLDERFYEDEEEEDTENTNHVNLPNFEGMSILQIMEESNRKMEQRIQERQAQEESDSSYPITDYSSNESSNNMDHEAEYREMESLLVETTAANSNYYKPSNILCSPVKSKSQAKQKRRLFIREKIIPKWAEDLQKLDELAFEQRNDPRIDPDRIFGRCVVEHLNTNVIFRSNAMLYRGSSAKWKGNLMSQFVT